MRLRLGLLQDSAAIEKQAAREAAEAKAKKQKLEAPTVKTEAQTKADEAAAASKEKEKGTTAAKTAPPKPRIRPLSEAKAIDSGANFISEAFLFLVAGGLIVFESWRSRRKETSRREDVAGRITELEESEKAARRALVELEKEILRLRAKDKGIFAPHTKHILPKEIWAVEEQEEKEDEAQSAGWGPWMRRLWPAAGTASEPDIPAKGMSDKGEQTGKETRHGDSNGSKHSRSFTPSDSKATDVKMQR
ncbi:MAG: hypothetical protein LQ347_001608 [Umbilicaria vellea]|nr:MAG: hypothetical protein LQ347_001608 [Umbilicaria vellea]